ncbi:MAG: hypothetical protein WBW84_10490 [Acidobacteriaceae bacterium]
MQLDLGDNRRGVEFDHLPPPGSDAAPPTDKCGFCKQGRFDGNRIEPGHASGVIDLFEEDVRFGRVSGVIGHGANKRRIRLSRQMQNENGLVWIDSGIRLVAHEFVDAGFVDLIRSHGLNRVSMGEAGPTAFAVVEKANPEAERRWSATDCACALAIGTDGRRRWGCRRSRLMQGRRIEQRSHRRALRPDSAVTTQAAGDVT